jgi:hypothetical protein
LYEYTEDGIYLEVVENAFPYYYNYFLDNPNVAMITWHSQAYSKAFFLTKKRKYADYVFLLNDWSMLKQISQSENETFLGGYGTSPGISTAVYNEGMNDVYLVAKELGDSRIGKYRESIKLSNKFILQLQTTNKKDINALGGFKKSLRNPNQRIDNNQHAINSMIKSLKNYDLIYN